VVDPLFTDPEVSVQLEESLKDCREVRWAHLFCNRVSNLVAAVHMRLPLQSIELTGRPASETACDVAHALATSTCTSVRSFVVLAGRKRLKGNATLALATLVAKSRSLATLVLDSARLADETIVGVAAALAGSTCLLYLYWDMDLTLLFVFVGLFLR
jgi:hypothetical protein